MLDVTKQKYNAYDRPHDDLREFLARYERSVAARLVVRLCLANHAFSRAAGS